MKIVEELVAPALQRADIDADRASRRYDLFTMQRRALELRRDCLLVADRQFHLGAGRNFHLGRDEGVISDRDRDRAGIRRSGECGEQHEENGKGERAHFHRSAIDNRSQHTQHPERRQPGFAQTGCAKSPRKMAPPLHLTVSLHAISAITLATIRQRLREETRCWTLAYPAERRLFARRAKGSGEPARWRWGEPGSNS